MALTYAVIMADPADSRLGEIVSRHKTRGAAERKLRSLSDPTAYVATRKVNGFWATREEAQFGPVSE